MGSTFDGDVTGGRLTVSNAFRISMKTTEVILPLPISSHQLLVDRMQCPEAILLVPSSLFVVK